jgi:hypothetical protein
MTKENKKFVKELVEKLTDIASSLEQISTEEQDLFEEHSDNWKDSDKGDEAQNTIGEIETATGAVYEAIELLEALP